MARNEIQELLDQFADGSGFGDPDARRDAEQRLQIQLAKEQQKTSARLNLLTLLLVVVGFLNFVGFAFQIYFQFFHSKS